MLKISKHLVLPLDFITQTQAVLAMKGTGKSYTSAVQAEELLKANQQIVAIDPTGAWWGLKSSADGKSPGFPIVIFGGEHADVPLEEGAGEVIATAIVENKFSAILDLKLLRKRAMVRLVTDFLEALFHKNRDAMHLFVDECDLFAPQKIFKGQEACLGAMEDIVRRGRSRGIGASLISQRPQVIAKDVLSQCGMITALRMMHPREISAIHEWVAVHGDESRYIEMKASLPSLPTGTAWIWAPGWNDLFQKVEIRERITFNSSATPKPGEVRKNPKVVAEVDLKVLGQQIQATIQKQKENNPAELKKKIAELEKKQAAAVPDERVIQARISREISAKEKQYAANIEALESTVKRLRGHLQNISETITKELGIQLPSAPKIHNNPPVPVVPTPQRVSTPSSTGDRLSTGETAILKAIAGYSDGATKSQLTILTGYAKSSRDTYIFRLKSKGLVESNGDRTIATKAGLDQLGDSFEPLPAGSRLLEHWRNRLSEGERKILNELVSAYPSGLRREQIDESTGYAKSSRDTYINRLTGKRLVEIPSQGTVRASNMLFD